MTTDIANKPQVSLARTFRHQASTMATSLLKEWVGEKRAGEAAGRISAALSAAAGAAKDPSQFYKCTLQSIGQCIALSALTGIMPSTGSGSLAYIYPQAPRRGEAPQLQFVFSHRGLNALARRSGQTMIAVPIGKKDVLTFTNGECRVTSQDVDDPPMTHAELRGVLLVVKELHNSAVTHSGFVPVKVIEARRKISRAWSAGQSGPWKDWPVEMAMKTAMHYAISRGWCVIDDTTAVKSLHYETEFEQVKVSAEPAPAAGFLETATSEDAGDAIAAQMDADHPPAEDKPKRGRPKGSTNKPKQDTAPADGEDVEILYGNISAELQSSTTVDMFDAADKWILESADKLGAERCKTLSEMSAKCRGEAISEEKHD